MRPRIVRLRLGLAARQRIAEPIEGCPSAADRLDERRERLAGVDEHRLALLLERDDAEDLAIAAGEFLVAPVDPHDVAGVRVDLAFVEHRADAGEPQAVARAGPAEPALLAQVEQRLGIAVDVRQAVAARASIGPRAVRR